MLEIKNLSKKNRVEPGRLTLHPGTLYTLLGPNGAGKSTLLHLIGGFLKADSGEVLWNEEPLLQKERKEISQIVTLIPQTLSPTFPYTVWEMVAMGRYASENSQEKVNSALGRVDALQFKNRPITELSGGEMARIYLARALATEAPILLLDEPTANLDIYHQLKMWELLESLAKEGKLIIAIHHRLDFAERFGDEAIIMNKGRIIGTGSYSELITNELLSDVFQVKLTCVSSTKPNRI